VKVLILAGGFGTRLSEETSIKPKPMVEIGEYPILWHIMKSYYSYGFDEFVILLGYKGFEIKKFFSEYPLRKNDLTIDLKTNSLDVHCENSEPWKVTLLDTGLNTLTGGRIKRAHEFIGDEPFLLTYGDGLADVDIRKSVEFHKQHRKLITMTAVQPTGRFGALTIEDNCTVSNFQEKPKGDGTWINGGYFVCEPQVLDYIEGDRTIFEQEPLMNLASEGQLVASKHRGFWQCMDTLSDKEKLCQLWEEDKALWKVW